MSALIALSSFAAPDSGAAADRISPYDFISPDAPAFDELSRLIERIESEGAEIFEVRRTFLGRLRILAVSDGWVREIIVSPNTGQVRRDIVLGPAENEGSAGATARAGNAPKGNAYGRNGTSPGNNGQGNSGQGGGEKGNNGQGNGNKSKPE